MLNDFTFLKDGFQFAGHVFSPEETRQLLAEAMATRDFKDIFFDEADFRANPQYFGVHPRVGRNLLAKLNSDFIFSNERFVGEMTKVLGKRWRIMDHKFVMGVPDSYMPEWIQKECEGKFIANLGPYIKPQYRDITYFHGIDFHQDIIDFPDRESDFITAYIYLDEVGSDCSPLYVLPGSHLLGASIFPHKVDKNADGSFNYENDFEKRSTHACFQLTGAAGSLYYWHSSVLHGTQPQVNDRPRISVRLLVDKNSKEEHAGELDQVNATIQGPLSLGTTRRDRDERGVDTIRGNLINKLI